MKTQIEINCPDCHSSSLKKNGIKSYGKQNYQCKDCKRQFIGDHALTYKGNNCRLRHRLRRAVRKTCCFSKKLDNHFKVFDLVFFYVNYGYV
ncbi:IS1 family transposase [Psychrobacter sp. Sa4CVA2]|uniref:IS1 family transposase n=1 Tax=Psychrobacter communis TaxID=2762238 RepID=A0ABR8RGN4_9GAMM|nr:IS1 family transposase [Psychrobacter communis]MBD7946968.1 IS1 family transposase [Psychrobacter communis]